MTSVRQWINVVEACHLGVREATLMRPVKDKRPKTILDLLQASREFLTPRWFAYKDSMAGDFLDPDDDHSSEMCRVSSVFLLGLLDRYQEHLGSGWRLAGGHGDAGFKKDGWRPHYWITDAAGQQILDVTATQFGGPPVVLTTTSSPYGRRYRDHLDREDAQELRSAAHIAHKWIEEWDERLVEWGADTSTNA